MSKEAYQDDIFILRVQNWQTADKYAVCFSRFHGKISFIAFGARYPRSTYGRLIQPFAQLSAQFTPGARIDALRQCESLFLPEDVDIETLAYGAVITEVTENLTSENESQEEIYDLLLQAYKLLRERNKRIVTISTLLKLLVCCGFTPELTSCTSCHKEITKAGYFSLAQGGFLCSNCAIGDELPCSIGTKELMENLINLDFTKQQEFVVRGAELMELEQILYKFILYQTDKPLKSLNFLGQMQGQRSKNI
jgi:DNA repair protein RecO (recombination protein O)